MLFWLIQFYNIWTFLGSSVGKESACSAGDPDSVPGSGRCRSWRKKWQTTPVFLSGKSHGQRTLVDEFHGVKKSRAFQFVNTSNFIFPVFFFPHVFFSYFCSGLNSVYSKSMSTWNLIMCSHLQKGFLSM